MPTPQMVSVPALCEFSHQGRTYVRGEMVDCTPLDASILARAGKVSLTRQYVTTAASDGRYRRRDMRASE